MNHYKDIQFDPTASRDRCKRLRLRILDISQQVGALHMAGAYSCMEITEAIYFWLMRRDNDGKSPDTFLMSKGHGCMAQYVALEELGVLSREDMDKYCKAEGILGCHPDYGNPGIEASTGSLGHGLSLGMGMAYADKIQKTERNVYVVLSDGEFQEGSTWEAMMLAPSFGITNLIGFLDLNDFQSLGQTSKILPNFYPIKEKIESFGWESVEVDGHSNEEVYNAVVNRKGDKPLMVIAHTTKGKGISYMESVPIWHYRSPSPEEYIQGKKELEEA